MVIKMNKKNGFTLIELLAVIVILGIIMLIAIPNIISTLDKNKKDTLLKDAQRMVSAAEYKMTNPSSEEPNANKIIIIALKDQKYIIDVDEQILRQFSADEFDQENPEFLRYPDGTRDWGEPYNGK